MAVVAGLLTWWNTDIFGRDRYCGDTLSSSQVNDVLNGSGRLRQLSSREKPFRSFECSVKRTSKFIDSPQSSVEISTEFMSGISPFQSHVWQNGERASYTREGLAGGATPHQAWLLVPSSCWKRILTETDFVPFFTATVIDGKARPDALMRLTYRAAQRALENEGCEAGGVLGKKESKSIALTETERGRTDVKNACETSDFVLPSDAFPGRSRPGLERVTKPVASTAWTCDLYLEGEAGPSLSLSVSSHQDVVSAAGKQKGSATWRNAKLVRCDQGDMYLGLWSHGSYLDLHIDEYKRSGKEFSKVFDEILTSLAKSKMKSRHWSGCSIERG
ncbi:hypothetical protein [Streptomyces sp. NPDC007083]|uniref:hypothetical protein n=1 Tax=unclassified Streptomyces TaxID=2593676 RepID=UPI0033D56994